MTQNKSFVYVRFDKLNLPDSLNAFHSDITPRFVRERAKSDIMGAG